MKKSRSIARWPAIVRFAAVVAIAMFGCGAGQTARAGDAVPHLDDAGQSGYRAYLDQPMHSAFAIAPGGVWTWVSGMTTPALAEQAALQACRERTDQPCHVYAVDGQVVFNDAAWRASWDLGLSPERIAAAPIGTTRADRYPNLALRAPDGKPMTLADLRGKVVFLHYWGSWCPPCKIEFPELQALYDALAGDPNVAFVVVQAREAIATSRTWAAQRAITLPLYDSGHQGREDRSFRLGDGSTLDDRQLAPVYPTTYVLDAQGAVVFRKAGPGQHWAQYAPLIRYLASRSDGGSGR